MIVEKSVTDGMVKDGHLGGYYPGGDPGTWCPHLWNWAVHRFDVRSVLDVGCADGQSTKSFSEIGCDVLGIDGCRQAVESSAIPECTVRHDFCDGAYVPDRGFDMIWCCEFLEHVDERFLPNVLETFSCATRVLLITHAFPGQEGHHHVNCRPTRYWIHQIEELGFRCAVDSTRQARTVTLNDHIRINHFARSGLVFLRESLLSDWPADEIRARAGAARKAAEINFGFRFSRAVREHRSRRRAWKRLQLR